VTASESEFCARPGKARVGRNSFGAGLLAMLMRGGA
jgi:hypothetical protein